MANSGDGWRDLAERDEGRLAYPGSRVLFVQGHDQGEGHGFDQLDKSADLSRWLKANASPDDILQWFDNELGGRGWVREPGSRGTKRKWFRRGLEQVAVIIREPGVGMWMPPESEIGPGTVYEITYKQKVPLQK
jgi:hypothetical protein